MCKCHSRSSCKRWQIPISYTTFHFPKGKWAIWKQNQRFLLVLWWSVFHAVFSLIHDGLFSYFSNFSLHIWKVCFAVQSLCLFHTASLHVRAFSLVLCNPWWYIHISVWATLRLVTNSEQVSRACGLWASPQGELVRETQISTYTSLSSWAGWLPQTEILWSLVWRVRAWLPAC